MTWNRYYIFASLIFFHGLQGLSLLPLMEPSITASLDLFAPFGSSPPNAKIQLKGSFGNAMLDNIPDYYSQLLTKVRLCLSFFFLPCFYKQLFRWAAGLL